VAQRITRILHGTPYDLLVGREGRILDVRQFGVGTPPEAKAVFIVVEGETYVVAARDGTAPGIALLSDIDLGRHRWRGLQVRPKAGMTDLVTYDGETGSYGKIPVSSSDTLTIADVVAGYVPCAPVRVILTTAAGREGYQDVAVSKTNCRSNENFSTFTERFDVVTASGGRD
jgi:hypothetical protein